MSETQQEIDKATELARLTGQLSAEVVIAFYQRLLSMGFPDDTALELTHTYLSTLQQRGS